MNKLTRRLTLLVFTALLATGVAGISGCAGGRSVDVDVNAFASWPPGVLPAPGSTYRFDRLPSQQLADPQRDQLELLTRDALARKGMQLNPNAPAYGVQVVLNAQMVSGPGYSGTSVGIGAGSGGFSGVGVGFSFPIGGAAQGEYRTELVVLVRNLQNNTVVYETRAAAQTVSMTDPAVRAALVDNALRNFPLATAGTLRTRVNFTP